MRKALLLFPLFLLVAFSVQSQYLAGRVRNEAGGNAARVNVNFTRKDNKVITNDDGTFRILASHLPDTLVFSAPGYEPYKVVITEKNIKDPEFEVVLLDKRDRYIHETPTVGSEVVVTAHGTKRKAKDIGYATTTIKGSDLGGTFSGSGEGSFSHDSKPVVKGYSRPPLSYEAVDAITEHAGKKLYLADTSLPGRKPVATRAGMLTAGEVNDFNKWKMWEEYTAIEFKSMSRFWGMFTDHRYSVQLTDKNYNAIVNEPVYLVNKTTHDTVWRAITDNTGKAELWAGFANGKGDSSDYIIRHGSGTTIQSPSVFANGINLLTVNQGCQTSNEVDISFVVDATGSMGDEIEFLKLELEDVIRKIMEKHSSLSVRASSVFYRDKSDEYIAKNAAFNDDLLKTINFIKLQKAGGGGDYPEAVDKAMEMAIDSLGWNKNARTRILFLLLDAPPHNEDKDRVMELTVKAAAMGIRIVPVACSGTDKSTEFFLRSMALATNGTYAFLTNHSGIGNKHIEPTTDKYAVEMLNELMQRITGQFVVAKECETPVTKEIFVPERQPGNILSIKIYPNPTTGRFTIESNKEISELFITDFSGKILKRVATDSKIGKWDVDITGYPSAAYLVRYITKANKWGALKIVLSR
jgi:hypothetical protein